ncbi:MAG: hypothetical protein A3J37_00645 [Alphaproteobacteria bacterium RIFCSPHIGHO2_12_FULL_45_9]|nr:MAG: hypothetical protein A3J37_00645 [Alphaproteobacteria bacterium RIFCSPHIGHO2_12_FULL_45_9]
MGVFDGFAKDVERVGIKKLTQGKVSVAEAVKTATLDGIGDLTGVLGNVNHRQSQHVDPNGVARRPEVAASQQGANVNSVTRNFLQRFDPAGTPGQGQQRPSLGEVLLAAPGQILKRILPEEGGALDRAIQGAKRSTVGVAIAAGVAAGGGALADGADAVKTAASQPTAAVQRSDPAKGIYIERGADGQPAVAVNARAIEAEADKPSLWDRFKNAFSSEPEKTAVVATAKPPEPANVEAAPEAVSKGINLSTLEPKVIPPTTVPNTPVIPTAVTPTTDFKVAAAPVDAAPQVKPSQTPVLDALIEATKDASRLETLTKARAFVSKPAEPGGMN